MNTVGEYLEMNYEVRAYCRSCSHHRLVDLEKLQQHMGPAYRINRERLRCQPCQSLGADLIVSHKFAGRKSSL